MDRTITRLTSILLVTLLVVGVARSQMRSNKFGVGASGAYALSQTDRDPRSSIGGSLDITYSMTEVLGLRGSFGMIPLKTKTGTTNYQTTIIHANLGLSLDMAPNSTVNPFIFVGPAVQYIDPRLGTGAPIPVAAPVVAADVKRSLVVTGAAAVGVDIFFSEFFSMTIAGETSLPVSDRLDGLSGTNSKKDMFERVTVGFRYYFFDQAFISRMLKALEERYKK